MIAEIATLTCSDMLEKSQLNVNLNDERQGVFARRANGSVPCYLFMLLLLEIMAVTTKPRPRPAKIDPTNARADV